MLLMRHALMRLALIRRASVSHALMHSAPMHHACCVSTRKRAYYGQGALQLAGLQCIEVTMCLKSYAAAPQCATP
ncbi:Hypothetical protein NTJ_12708 [Nesidiocoris tenuis]|nr:Hypothetical protein NTJ_12708 [Nesidiocoris tenuis]